MRSRLIRGFAVPVAFSMLSGCAFTQWTDHAFIGSPSDPPTHVDREWAGAVILPLAVVGDVFTAPVQLVMLLIMKDYGLYARPNRAQAYRESFLLQPQDTSVAAVQPALRDELLRGVETRLAQQDGTGAGMTAWGIDSNHHVMQVPLTAEQQAQLAERLKS